MWDSQSIVPRVITRRVPIHTAIVTAWLGNDWVATARHLIGDDTRPHILSKIWYLSPWGEEISSVFIGWPVRWWVVVLCAVLRDGFCTQFMKVLQDRDRYLVLSWMWCISILCPNRLQCWIHLNQVGGVLLVQQADAFRLNAKPVPIRGVFFKLWMTFCRAHICNSLRRR